MGSGIRCGRRALRESGGLLSPYIHAPITVCLEKKTSDFVPIDQSVTNSCIFPPTLLFLIYIDGLLSEF